MNPWVIGSAWASMGTTTASTAAKNRPNMRLGLCIRSTSVRPRCTKHTTRAGVRQIQICTLKRPEPDAMRGETDRRQREYRRSVSRFNAGDRGRGCLRHGIVGSRGVAWSQRAASALITRCSSAQRRASVWCSNACAARSCPSTRMTTIAGPAESARSAGDRMDAGAGATPADRF
jgi:hypothetical protein